MAQIKQFTVLVFLFLISGNLYAQNKVIDSLKRVLLDPKLHDTTRLAKMSDFVDQSISGTADAEIFNEMMGRIASESLRKANTQDLRTKYTKYLAAHYSNKAGTYQMKRDIPKALSYLDKSIFLFRKVNATDEMNYAIVNKGIVYSQINEKQKAIQCLFTALKYFEEKPQERQDGISYVNATLATIYSDQKMYEKAIVYSARTINYLSSVKNPTGDQEIQLSEAYINCGTYYLNLKKYEKALSNLNKALAIFKRGGNTSGESICLNKIAQVKMEEGKLQEAEGLLQEALKSDQGETSTAYAYITLGDLFYRKKELARSESFLSKGFEMAKAVRNLQLQEKASELLLKVSRENRNFEKALEMYEFQTKLNDSGKIEASKNALAQQQLRYDYEKKQLNLELNAEKREAAKNNWLIALSGALLLLLSGGYFYYRNNRQKQEITVLEKDRIRQKLLLSQMNPHFIFNSIDNIQSLIINGKEQTAVSYLDRFSRLTRQILENSGENYISLQEEVHMIENYVAIQRLLYKDHFDFTIAMENVADAESFFIPPMLTQPFIENAIKHGLKNKAGKGEIKVVFSYSEDRLLFEISDNGTGFSNENKPSDHKSMAMKITRERLLNYAGGRNFEVVSENRRDAAGHPAGVKITFEIPYIYEN